MLRPLRRYISALPLRQPLRPVKWSVATLGVGLLLAGCGLNDLSAWSWETGEPDDMAISSPTVQPTNTPWRYQPATHTPWAYSTQTPTPRPAQTSTPTPTRTPTSTRTPTPLPTPSPTPATDYLTLLPSVADVPGKLELMREDAAVTVAEVGEGFGAGTGLVERLDALDYRGGALREFALSNPGLRDYLSRLLGMQTAVLEFGTAAQAQDALDAQQDFARNQPDWNLNTRNIDTIGDATVALTGDAVYDGTDVVVVAIFVRDGARVYRFISISGTYDAWGDTVRLARETVS